MVLGNYYLTLERKDAVNTGTIFNDTNEVLKAYATIFRVQDVLSS
jgi:DNA-directed RNA polymerase subunit beta'